MEYIISRPKSLSPDWRNQSEAAWLLLSKSPGLMVDLSCLSAALFFVVLHQPMRAGQYGVMDVLRMRISLQNLILAGLCLVIWATVLRNAAKPVNRPLSMSRSFGLFTWQILACTAVAAMTLVLRHPEMAGMYNLALFVLLSTLLLLTSRLLLGAYSVRVQPAMRRPRTVLLVGAGWRGQKMCQELLQHPKWNYRSIGFVDTNPPDRSVSLLGELEDLEAILMSNVVDEVIITLPVKSMYDTIQTAIDVCERTGVQSRYFTDLFATQVTKRWSTDEHHPSSVLMHLVHDDKGRLLKRLLDVTVAAIGLSLLSPILVIIALAVRLTSDGPILFRQQRYGLNKRLFTMYKFRSMIVDAEQQQHHLEHLNETNGATFKLRRDPRVTRVGSLIRKTSLDELPQLWNVLIGNMSLVGPRPLPMRDVSKFSEAWLMRRFSVAPGITGLWQVSGRSETSFANWMKLDLDYIDNWTLFLDLKILAMTLPAVLKGEGAM